MIHPYVPTDYADKSSTYWCPTSEYRFAPNRRSTTNNSSSAYWGYSRTTIKRPTDKYLVADAMGESSSHTSVSSRACFLEGHYTPGSCRGHLYNPHIGKADIVFCDGHASSLRPGPDEYGDTTAGRNKYFTGNAP
jgi:prepilin-type processing-associated H-X9-DG protein